MKTNSIDKPPSIFPVDSRRDFFKKAFTGGVAATALGVVPINVRSVFGQSPTSDIDILNYALTLEHLEYAFYRDQLARFTAKQFRSRYGSFDGMFKGMSRRRLRESQAPQNSRSQRALGLPSSSASASSSAGTTKAAAVAPTPRASSRSKVTLAGGSSQATAGNGGSTSGDSTSNSQTNGQSNDQSKNQSNGQSNGNAQTRGSANGNSALTVYQFFTEIRDHEAAHVQTLTQTIQSLGGTPVQELEYDFGVDNLAEFVSLAQVLENTGVSAYDGAIALINSPELQTAGATIATVEARHAAFLNLLNGDSPFPQAFDTPKSMEEVMAAVAPFIVS